MKYLEQMYDSWELTSCHVLVYLMVSAVRLRCGLNIVNIIYHE